MSTRCGNAWYPPLEFRASQRAPSVAAGQVTVGPGSGRVTVKGAVRAMEPDHEIMSRCSPRSACRAGTLWATTFACSDDAFRSMRLDQRADQCRTTLLVGSVESRQPRIIHRGVAMTP